MLRKFMENSSNILKFNNLLLKSNILKTLN